MACMTLKVADQVDIDDGAEGVSRHLREECGEVAGRSRDDHGKGAEGRMDRGEPFRQRCRFADVGAKPIAIATEGRRLSTVSSTFC